MEYFIIALVVSCVVCGIIASGYKTHARTSTTNYTKSDDGSSSVRFKQREDVFVRTHTDRRPKSQPQGAPPPPPPRRPH